MPFTPFHIGAHACVALPMRRRINVIVFILANVFVDFEPLVVMLGGLDYPLHGYAHTFLIGGVLGGAGGLICYPAQRAITAFTLWLQLPAPTSMATYMTSGTLGVWLHVLFDAVIYPEMQPFWPMAGNIFHGHITIDGMYRLCTALVAPALGCYLYFRLKPKR